MTRVQISDGTDTVTIYGIDLVINYNKKPASQFDIPVPHPWSDSPEKRVMDLLQLDKSVTITGEITAQSLSGASTVWDVHDKILEFIEGGGPISLRVIGCLNAVRLDWGDPPSSSTYRAFITKAQFTVSPTDECDPSSMRISIQFLHAKDMSQG